MNEYRSVLERAGSNFAPLDLEFESLLRRRDRKRRNQRIAAGVVGIAVFVAGIWIVTSGGVFDRSETPAVPGGDVTGPAETRPAETGPAEAGPTETGPTVAPDTGSEDNSYRIPPDGTAVSTPVEGELIAESNFYPTPYVRVYADGRVLSTPTPGNGHYVERRLSPEGVELVRSGAVQPEDLLGPRHLVAESAWEDRVGIPYVPARYGACFWHVDNPPDFEALLEALPASAQALLRGSDPAAWNPRCLVVTPEEAHSLEQILGARSFAGDPYEVGRWELPLDATKTTANGDVVEISLRPLFPDGRRVFRIPF